MKTFIFLTILIIATTALAQAQTTKLPAPVISEE